MYINHLSIDSLDIYFHYTNKQYLVMTVAFSLHIERVVHDGKLARIVEGECTREVIRILLRHLGILPSEGIWIVTGEVIREENHGNEHSQTHLDRCPTTILLRFESGKGETISTVVHHVHSHHLSPIPSVHSVSPGLIRILMVVGYDTKVRVVSCISDNIVLVHRLVILRTKAILNRRATSFLLILGIRPWLVISGIPSVEGERSTKPHNRRCRESPKRTERTFQERGHA
ncbi:hypothetical protein PMAYCL1PPCAC_06586, partial [Pristionchus mayeri]